MGTVAGHAHSEPDEDIDACDAEFSEGEQTKDEDLPVAFGGEG